MPLDGQPILICPVCGQHYRLIWEPWAHGNPFIGRPDTEIAIELPCKHPSRETYLNEDYSGVRAVPLNNPPKDQQEK
ncbi:MAG: hypothetical protein J2P36_03525 [Ktedonobacteraceae bacterium]|nr:hypothetical protein [Ktedonobacteraceae bacterium]